MVGKATGKKGPAGHSAGPWHAAMPTTPRGTSAPLESSSGASGASVCGLVTAPAHYCCGPLLHYDGRTVPPSASPARYYTTQYVHGTHHIIHAVLVYKYVLHST
jgi:hypothetical protein